MKLEIEDRLDRKIDSEENLNQTMIINDFKKINVSINTSQMKQCSILCNAMNNV